MPRRNRTRRRHKLRPVPIQPSDLLDCDALAVDLVKRHRASPSILLQSRGRAPSISTGSRS